MYAAMAHHHAIFKIDPAVDVAARCEGACTALVAADELGTRAIPRST